MQERGLAGRTEREVAIAAARLMVDLGAEGPSFPPIVASGPHGALPHAVPRDVEIPRGRARGGGHGRAGSTATARTARARSPPGRSTTRPREVYELVLRAQEEALAAVARGRRGVRRWTAWRATIIEAAGHGERFGHGLGHGVGLEVHEGPRRGEDGERRLRGRATW